MINPDFELERLRWNLQNRDLTQYEIDTVCRQASEDVNAIILDIISNAASEAVSHAESIEAWDFISDMDVGQDGWVYVVKTKSGLTDYSIDAVHNLPNLLKNAKTAADGSKYKVIPMKEKSNKRVIGTSSADVMAAQTDAANAARQSLRDRQGDRSARANVMAENFRQQIAQRMQARKEDDKRTEGPTTGFRTATSKQDAASQWVIPEKNRDMTQYLLDLNDRIKSTVEDSVMQIINSYQQEYL